MSIIWTQNPIDSRVTSGNVTNWLTAYTHSQLTSGNPHQVTKSDVGLGSVDNLQQLPLSYLDTDGTMAANSDTKVASQKAVVTYVAAHGGGSSQASGISVSTTSFNGILDSGDTTTQIALDTIDDHNHAVSGLTGWPASVSMTELGYLDGVTSALQTQIDGKSGTGHTHAQLHDPVTIADSSTINLTLVGQAVSGTAITQMSITSDASGLKLSGDSASPGNSMLYGTNGSGTKGWYAQPAGGGAYVPTSGGTMTGGLVLDLGSDVEGLRIQGAAGQTNNLLTIEDSTGADLMSVNSTGLLIYSATDFALQADTADGSDNKRCIIRGGGAGGLDRGAGLQVIGNEFTGAAGSRGRLLFQAGTITDSPSGYDGCITFTTNNNIIVTYHRDGYMDIADGINIKVGTTTGTMIGTATTQKIGFWNATPIVQPTTSTTAAAFVANTGTAVNINSTFDGYTLQKIAKALRNAGILA